MGPRRRRAAPRVSEGSPSTGEPTKATFEPFSRIPSAVQSTEASQGQLDPPPADPIAFRAHARGLMEAAFDKRLRLLARGGSWAGGVG
jgi:hypothetical protein